MKYRYNEEFINRVRENNDLVEIASEYMKLTKNGDRYRGLCPFHKEDTPSFFISSDKQLYYCFGCGTGGNVINFIMAIENLDFIDAVQMLADRAGMEIPKPYLGNGSENRYKLINKIYSINTDAARFYAGSLAKNKRAFEYFMNRGIQKDTIVRYGLGYAPGGWDKLLNYLQRKGYSAKDINTAGLSIQKKEGTGYYDRFRDRVIFPVMNTRNKVVGFGGRVLNHELPKYINSPETPVFIKRNNLYGLNIAKQYIHKEEIMIVEGYMDVISLHQAGIKNAVASLGTAFTEQQAKKLKRYCNSILIAYDADAAGQAATLRGLDILQSVGFNIRILEMPEGKDPDEFIKTYGKEAFQQLIDIAVSFIDYRIKLIKEKYDLNDTQQKLRFLEEVAAILAKLSSEIQVSEYIKHISHNTGIYEAALRKEILSIKKAYKGYKKNVHGKNRHDNSTAVLKQSMKTAVEEAEENILALMLNNDQQIYKHISGRISEQDFQDAFHGKIFKMIVSENTAGRIKVADLINRLDTQQQINRIIGLEQKYTVQENGDINKFIEDCINVMRVNRQKRRVEQIKHQIAVLSDKAQKTEQEEETYRQLCKEFVDIQRNLRGLL